MMTVRFPNGPCLRYNTAMLVRTESTGYALFDGDNKFIAKVPHEAVAPCAVYWSPEPKEHDELQPIRKALEAIRKRLPKRMMMTIPAVPVFARAKGKPVERHPLDTTGDLARYAAAGARTPLSTELPKRTAKRRPRRPKARKTS